MFVAFALLSTSRGKDAGNGEHNLGNVLAVLGERVSGEQGAQYLEQSVAAYRAALQVTTREQLPQDWAMMQNNLGNVLAHLGERVSGKQGAQYFERERCARERRSA
jgi:hypothetical protein